MLSDDTLSKLSDNFAQRMEDATEFALEKIVKRIKEIGTLSKSDIYKLNRLRDNGVDIKEIERYLSQQTQRNITDIKKIYEKAAESNAEFAYKYFELADVPFIPYSENKPLQQTVEALAKITANEFTNFSRTTAFAIKQVKGGTKYLTLADGYKDLIDRSIYAVRSGTTDYNSAIRRIIKEYAKSGLRTCETVKTVYESGYSRTLETAVRQSVLDGVKYINHETQRQLGEQFGADAVELSAHLTCAPDHLNVQGHQFSLDEFENMQIGLPCEDLQGREYAGFRRKIGEWNCRHFTFYIVAGAAPNYSDEELQKMKKDNLRQIQIGNKTQTPYQWSQIMRELETEIRKEKRVWVALNELGDKQGKISVQNRIRKLKIRYYDIAAKTGLPVRKNRMSVSGYHGR